MLSTRAGHFPESYFPFLPPLFSVDTFNPGWLWSLAKCKEGVSNMSHHHMVDTHTGLQSLDVRECVDALYKGQWLPLSSWAAACSTTVIAVSWEASDLLIILDL